MGYGLVGTEQIHRRMADFAKPGIRATVGFTFARPFVNIRGVIACPQCGHLNPNGETTCGGCGSSVAVPAMAASGAGHGPTAALPSLESLAASQMEMTPPAGGPGRPPVIRVFIPQAGKVPRRGSGPLRPPGDEAAVPVPSLAININHVLVHDCPTSIGLLIENRGASPIEDIEITLESLGLRNPVHARLPELKAQWHHRWPHLDLVPVGPSTPALHCRARFSVDGQEYRYRGSTDLVVFQKPKDPENVSIIIQDILSPKAGGGHNAGLGQELGNVEIKNLFGDVQDLNKLLSIRLPEQYIPIPIEFDYEISETALTEIEERRGETLKIPGPFRKIHAPATTMRLLPAKDIAALPGVREIRIFARPDFRFGRDLKRVDFHTTFGHGTSRNKEEAESLDKRLSRVHLTARLTTNGPVLFDGDPDGTPSSNGTNYDGQAVEHGAGIPIKTTGRLILAGEYFLDIIPCDSGYEGDKPSIELDRWAGRKSAKDVPPPARGAMRFRPYANNPTAFDALWLFTDASWGSSEWNAVVTPHPALDEIQARFHHYRGCFWLEHCSDDRPLTLDNRELKPGQIAPLASGQTIQIGSVSFEVQTKA